MAEILPAPVLAEIVDKHDTPSRMLDLAQVPDNGAAVEAPAVHRVRATVGSHLVALGYRTAAHLHFLDIPDTLSPEIIITESGHAVQRS